MSLRKYLVKLKYITLQDEGRYYSVLRVLHTVSEGPRNAKTLDYRAEGPIATR